MSDMTQMSSERIWQLSIHTRYSAVGALSKAHCGALQQNSISRLIKSVINIIPYLYQLRVVHSPTVLPQWRRDYDKICS